MKATKKTRWIALDVLQPGDIVLTGSRESASTLIQIATGSRYSHAALIVDPLLWFESVQQGVRFTVPQAFLAETRGMLRCLTEVPAATWIRVQRPNNLHGCSQDRLYSVQNALISSTAKQFLLDYPGYENFLDIVRFGLGKTKFAMEVARRLSRRKTIQYPGLFCSAVAIQSLRDAGVNAMQGRVCSTVTPGRIAKSAEFSRIEAFQSPDGAIRAEFSSLNESLRRNQISSNALANTAMELAPR